jgi:phosphate:Na+ symporter
VTESAAIADSARAGAALESSPAWDRLKAGVLAALVTTSGEPEAFKSEFDQEMEEVDQAYQAIKKDLLTSAAAGRATVEAAEAALLRARRMRRVAEAALKAERRLCPWAPVASGRVENAPPVQA